MDPATWLPSLLAAAVLLPLGSFALIVFLGSRMGRAGVGAGYLATAAIGLSGLISFVALFGFWVPSHRAAAAGTRRTGGARAPSIPTSRCAASHRNRSMVLRRHTLRTHTRRRIIPRRRPIIPASS